MKRVALLSGDDLEGVSVEYLLFPDDMDYNKQREAWKEWYNKTYLPELRGGEKQPEFIDMKEWLILHGAREMDDIEEIRDD